MILCIVQNNFPCYSGQFPWFIVICKSWVLKRVEKLRRKYLYGKLLQKNPKTRWWNSWNNVIILYRCKFVIHSSHNYHSNAIIHFFEIRECLVFLWATKTTTPWKCTVMIDNKATHASTLTRSHSRRFTAYQATTLGVSESWLKWPIREHIVKYTVAMITDRIL
jgi:hypothetical protein